MGILELLTVIFVILKLIGTIDWSWWLVLLPTLISIGFYIIMGAIGIFVTKAFGGFIFKGRK
jgi:hypothetical protein